MSRLVLYLSCCLVQPVFAGERPIPSPAEVWARALQAKGGEAQLLQCKSLLMSQRNWFVTWFKRYHLVHDNLYVFPDRHWMWDDERPSVLGLNVFMTNLNKRLDYFTDDSEILAQNRGMNDDAVWNLQHKLISIQTVFMLETAWCHPKPVAVKSIRIGMRSSFLLRAELDVDTFDYYLDGSSYLPSRVVRHRGSQYPSSAHLADVYDLSRYLPVQGIQMPARIIVSEVEGLNIRWVYDVSYQLNVDYDADVFERPPSVKLGRYAWKRK